MLALFSFPCQTLLLKYVHISAMFTSMLDTNSYSWTIAAIQLGAQQIICTSKQHTLYLCNLDFLCIIYSIKLALEHVKYYHSNTRVLPSQILLHYSASLYFIHAQHTQQLSVSTWYQSLKLLTSIASANPHLGLIVLVTPVR